MKSIGALTGAKSGQQRTKTLTIKNLTSDEAGRFLNFIYANYKSVEFDDQELVGRIVQSFHQHWWQEIYENRQQTRD